MSDDTQIQKQDDTASQNNQNQAVHKPQVTQTPPSYAPSKEGEPINIGTKELSGSQEIVATETEPKIEDKELEKFIEVENQDPQIHPDLKKAGLQAIETTSLDPKQRIHLPISDDKVMAGLDEPLSSSFRWLAEFALFMLKRAHITLKKLHGHVVRVIQR